jgi:hypothetical protein
MMLQHCFVGCYSLHLRLTYWLLVHHQPWELCEECKSTKIWDSKNLQKPKEENVETATVTILSEFLQAWTTCNKHKCIKSQWWLLHHKSFLIHSACSHNLWRQNPTSDFVIVNQVQTQMHQSLQVVQHQWSAIKGPPLKNRLLPGGDAASAGLHLQMDP